MNWVLKKFVVYILSAFSTKVIKSFVLDFLNDQVHFYLYFFWVVINILAWGQFATYPCGGCKKSVMHTQRGLRCNVCVNWFTAGLLWLQLSTIELWYLHGSFLFVCLVSFLSVFDIPLPIKVFWAPCEGIHLTSGTICSKLPHQQDIILSDMAH